VPDYHGFQRTGTRQYYLQKIMHKITTIIFDIGNVLVRQRFEELAAETAENEEECRFLTEQVFGGSIWRDLDNGTYEREEELQAMLAVCPEREPLLRRFFWSLGNCFEPFEGSKEWIQELKGKGYRVYALSNWGRPFYEQGKEKLDFLEEMDGYMLSYRYHMLKPDLKYYELLLDTYGICPKEAVFIDDVEKNIRAAQELGIQGIVYQSREQARQELVKLGVM